MTSFELFLQLILVILTIVIHELFHYLVALFLGYSPRFGIEKNLMPYVQFQNSNRDVDNLLIALSAPLGMFCVGLFLPNILIFRLVKFVCLINIIHILPICSDGQIILLSIINQLKKVS